MSIVAFSGFETNSLDEWASSAGTGSLSVQSSVKNTGSYALQVTTTSDYAYLTAVAGGNRISFYIYISSLPSADAEIYRYFGRTALSGNYSLVLTTTGEIDVYLNGSKAIDGTTQLSTGQWYRVSASADITNEEISTYIDGTVDIDAYSTEVTAGRAEHNIGVITSCSATIYFDDIVKDDIDSGDDIGDIRVAPVAKPNGLYSTYEDYTPSTGTDHWACVDNAPSESDSTKETDYLYYVDKAVAYEAWTMEGCSDIGIDSGDTIKAVKAMLYYKLSKSGGTTPNFSINIGGGFSWERIADTDGVAVWDSHSIIEDALGYPYDPLTPSNVDGAFLNIQHYDGEGVDDYLYTAWLMVAYSPAASATEVNATSESLSVTKYNPAITFDVGVSAGNESLVVTEHNPTISVAVNVEVEAALETVALTKYNPTITFDTKVAAGLKSVSLTPHNPTVNASLNVEATPVSIGLTKYNPDVNASREVAATCVSISLTKYNPDVTATENVEVTAGVKALALTKYNPTVNKELDIDAGAASLSLTPHGATVNKELNVEAGQQALGITVYNPVVNVSLDVPAGLGSLTVTAYDTTVNIGLGIDAGTQALTLTAYDTTVNRELDVDAGSASIALTKYNPSVATSSDISAGVEAITVTPYNSTVNAALNIEAGSASLSLSKYDTVVNRELDIDAGYQSLNVTAYDVAVNASRKVDATCASVAVSPQDTTVNTGEGDINATCEAIAVSTHNAGVVLASNVQIDNYTVSLMATNAVRGGTYFTDEDTGYVIFVDYMGDLYFKKTTDGGYTWNETLILEGGIIGTDCVADWQIPGDSGTKINILVIDGGNENIKYAYVDTADDSYGTAVIESGQGDGTVYSSSTNKKCSITKSVGGKLGAAFVYRDDSGTWFYKFYVSSDGSTWTSKASPWESTVSDTIALFPGNETDPDDIWGIFRDYSSSELSLKTYDASADSWSEQLISSSMAASVYYPNMDGAIMLDNGYLYLVAWSAWDTSTADLTAWVINGASSITQKTNLVTDRADSIQVGLFIDQNTGNVYVCYHTGTAAFATITTVYQYSDDGMTTWSGELPVQAGAEDDMRWVSAGCHAADGHGRFLPVFYNDDLDDLFCNPDYAVIMVSPNTTIRPEVVSITVTPNNATVSKSIGIDASAESISVTAYDPIVNRGLDVDVSAVSVSVTTYGTSVSKGMDTDAGSAELLVTTYNPTVNKELDIEAGAAAVVTTTYNPTTILVRYVDADTAAMVVTTYDAVITYDKNADTSAAAVAVTAYPAVIKFDTKVNADIVTVAVTTYNTTFTMITSWPLDLSMREKGLSLELRGKSLPLTLQEKGISLTAKEGVWKS